MIISSLKLDWFQFKSIKVFFLVGGFVIRFAVFVLRNLTLKFGQNQVSNRGYVADVVIVIVVDVVVVLRLILENYF